MKQTIEERLHKHIEILKQQLEKERDENKKLKEKLSEFDYRKANQGWVEND
jgi:predicted RNase H-like nuclease (RuvC/YqgF family)|tara:strand:- start:2387 stop:2539 length:153 start_codon:yes stop_codon:yes gene_type:complete